MEVIGMKLSNKLVAIILLLSVSVSNIFAYPSYSITQGYTTTTYYRPFISDYYTTGHSTSEVNALIKSLESNYPLQIEEMDASVDEEYAMLKSIQAYYTNMPSYIREIFETYHDTIYYLYSAYSISSACYSSGAAACAWSNGYQVYLATSSAEYAGYDSSLESLVHETGHLLYWIGLKYGGYKARDVEIAFNNMSGGYGYSSSFSWEDKSAKGDYYVSGYASSSVKEDFAETYLYYICDVTGISDFEPVFTNYTRIKEDYVEAFLSNTYTVVTAKAVTTTSKSSSSSSTSKETSDVPSTLKAIKARYEDYFNENSGLVKYTYVKAAVINESAFAAFDYSGYRNWFADEIFYLFEEYHDVDSDGIITDATSYYVLMSEAERIAGVIQSYYEKYGTDDSKTSFYSFISSKALTKNILKNYVSCVLDHTSSACLLDSGYAAYVDENTEKTTKVTTTESSDSPSVSSLAAYSAMNMNVYPSSRVTDIAAISNGFVVSGYMFEANANCTSDLWREIVFVNSDDLSTSKAYRKQVTPLYNTWLNSNKTATVNGRYTLNYANYMVSVNPLSVNTYVGNISNQRMASGNYYVYMRISNGSTSYLFPLTDTTLSDGTNLENTGKLPSGFKVYNSENRALMYTVN